MIEVAPGRVRGLFLREERPGPAAELVRRAEANCACVRDCLPEAMIRQVQALASDNAAVGGRNAVALVNEVPLENLTDVFVDVSGPLAGRRISAHPAPASVRLNIDRRGAPKPARSRLGRAGYSTCDQIDPG